MTPRQWVREVKFEIHRKVMIMKDLDLVLALKMYQACDEPLRTNLGLKNDRDHFFVIGLTTAVVQYGGLTYKQRNVARRMVEWGMVYLEILKAKQERAQRLGVTPG